MMSNGVSYEVSEVGVHTPKPKKEKKTFLLQEMSAI